MKHLYIVRHAKSSRKEFGMQDIDRPLNDRGLNDALLMSKLIAGLNIKPELIISSPAIRALTTANIFADAFDINRAEIIIDKQIYSAELDDLLPVIYQQNDEIKKIMIVGHNPGFSYLANYLCKKFVDDMPTCSVVGLKIPLSNWNGISENCAELEFFEYPKKYK